MICEVGMPENEAGTCDWFITDLIHKVRAVNGGNGLGYYIGSRRAMRRFLDTGWMRLMIRVNRRSLDAFAN